jgi:dihydrofolate synthase/folylpolyglutamate synthase
MEKITYSKARSFIYERQHFGIKLGLDNITRFLTRIGNPQYEYDTVHIAGTNGKGSTASFIASILKESGYRTGLFTSPHLVDYRERIRVNGEKIPESAVTEFIGWHKTVIARTGITFFETTTALAFWHFQRQKVDIAVIETGLGGRLDASNVVAPAVTVITTIGLEHTNLLGKTRYKIAGEKGGIIKHGVPLVTGLTDNGDPAARRLRQICAERSAPAYFHPENGFAVEQNGRGTVLHLRATRYSGTNCRLALLGSHQGYNAFLAARTAEILHERGYKISRASIRRGLSTNYWPGRFMQLRAEPTIIIDAAHNLEGFTALADTLRYRFPGKQADMLIGMVEKKRGDRCLAALAPVARSISTAPLQTERRDDPYFLVSRLRRRSVPVRVYPSLPAACQELLSLARKSDILVISGSHFAIGEVAHLIRQSEF